jgi:regulator of replication initiation timing
MSATTRQDGNGLMHRAELAAKQVVCEWIRKTLRETFLQALQQTWSVVEENQVIEISSEGLQESLEAVERVSQAWQETLRQAEQESVPDWVQEVFDNGKDTCWSDVETNDDFSNDNTTMQLLNTLPDGEAPERTNSDLLNSSTEEEVGDEASPNPNNSVHHSMTEVPYCKLRSLGKRSRLGEPYLSTKDAIVQLQGMGQSGESYWPFDSNMLDQACAEIPNRMRCEQQNDNNTDNNISYQIIPKSVWEKKQQHQQEMARDSSATSGPTTDLTTTTTTTVIDGSQIVEGTLVRLTLIVM